MTAGWHQPRLSIASSSSTGPLSRISYFIFYKCLGRSGSMCQQDRQPLANSAGVDRITPTANDRLGSVFSALYSFWLARQAAVDRNTQLGGARRDSYSLIFFNHEPSICIENDFASSPDELLTAALQYEADGGTDFTRALERTQNIMDSSWSAERYMIVPDKSVHSIYTTR